MERFTALKIVKAEAGFFIKNRRLKPFALKKRPVVTESYKILHNFERMNLITATKKGRTGNISPLSEFIILNSDKLEKELEECEEQLKSIDSYLFQELSDYVDRIKNLSEKEIEEIVDSQYRKLIRGISSTPLYTHPIISKNINRVGSTNTFEDLIVQLRGIKEGKFSLELEADRRMIVRDLIIKWIERGDRYSIIIRMTEPANSELKNGECEFVCNYRYLEFLRNKNLNVMVFERRSCKYIVAIGKDCPEEWYPASAELYVFDVTGYDKERIDNFVRELERYATLVVAEKFKIPSNWKHEIFKIADNTWHKYRGCNDEEEFVREIDSFGGEVYFAYSVELKEFVHKPMDRTEVLDYLKRLLINLQNDLLRMDDEIEFDLSGCDNLEDFLRSLEKKLQDFRKGESDNEMRFKIPRPVRFEDIRNAGVFDCEIGAYLTLYFLIKYGSKFGVIELEDSLYT